MNPFTRIALSLFILVTLIFFSSCSKISDYIKHNPGSEVNVCRVKYLYEGSDTVAIYYNAAGDPSDMIKNNLAHGTWQGDKHFKYDNKQRLTNYYWANGTSKYRLIWHRYTYPRKNIITDSLFTYISDSDGSNPPIENFSALSVDSLDATGRIVKITDNAGTNYPVTTNYVYNAGGNLVVSNAVFDNKLSILRTSKIWMFLYKDYSANNWLNRYGGEMTVSAYNAAGLPLDFTVTSDHGSDVIFVTPDHKLNVVYDCN